MVDEEATEIKIDEGLYSRQLYVMGEEAMKKMLTSDILIVGMNGLGVEIAKNVILAGVKSVGVLDNKKTEMRDLTSQFYLSKDDIGKPRAEACWQQLAELNGYVNVEHVQGELTPELIRSGRFKVIVLVGQPLSVQVDTDKLCRELGLRFISADVCGMMGTIFVDNGTDFIVTDTNGEQPLTGMIQGITPLDPVEEDGETRHYLSVHVVDTRHGLEDGAVVLFDEIKGLEQLNGREFPIKYESPYKFKVRISDKERENLPKYELGGRFDQIKQSATISFKSLAEQMVEPDFLMTDFMKFANPPQLHCLYQAIDRFKVATGHAPRPHEEADLKKIEVLTKEIAAAAKSKPELDEKLIRKLARCSSAIIAPMAAAIGGMAAQEVLKACSGKFMPIRQFLYFDAIECLPDEALPFSEYQPLNCRYDDQIAVFGQTIQRKLTELNFFLVGAGAIGCEVLKNWACMGVGCSKKGSICVTDMDIIEKSNLNRQFLFRDRHVGQLKSATAAASVKAMNPDMNITPQEIRVGAETENVYNDKFWDNLFGVCTALDNVEARLYVDQKCVYHRKPMFESGTLGTKGNTQIVVPHITESYGSSRDPPEQSIPICTLKNFPNKIEHTLQWAREAFEGWFSQAPSDVNSYLSEPNYLKELAQSQNTQIDKLRTINRSLNEDNAKSFEDCIKWARLRFEEEFCSNIKQLLHSFPADSLTPEGAKFWSGSKRAPAPLEFSPKDEVHMEYIKSSANLRAFVYGIVPFDDVNAYYPVLEKIQATIPAWKPKEGLKIHTTDEEMQAAEEAGEGIDVDEAAVLEAKLPDPSSLAGYKLSPCEFEKDDPTNFHMDFITACANLRARNYSIREVTKLQAKRIAGKIIPAIATTTAAVTGLISLELFKMLQEMPIESYKNSFINLALPLVTASEPLPAPKTASKMKGEAWEYTLWDSIDIDRGDMTLGEFIDYIEDKLGLSVSMVSYGSAMLYAFWATAKKKKERRKMPMSKCVETVSKTTLRADQNIMILEACVEDDDGEDVEIPYIRLRFR